MESAGRLGGLGMVLVAGMAGDLRYNDPMACTCDVHQRESDWHTHSLDGVEASLVWPRSLRARFGRDAETRGTATGTLAGRMVTMMGGFMSFRMMLLVIVPALMCLGQGFWFVRAWRVIDAMAWPRARSLLRGLWMGAALVVLATVLDPMVGPVIPRRGVGPWVLAVSRLWVIASFFGGLAVISMEGLEWLSRPAIAALPTAQRERFEPARRTFFRDTAYLAGSLPLLATAYGTTAGRRRYRLTTVEVPWVHLPPSLDGLRIVQLSDIHIGTFMPRTEVRRAVAMANAVQADLAVLTGDLISDDHDPLEDCIAELSRLRVPLGIWGCNGNHERYAGVEARAQALFQRYGMRLLRQQCTEVSWRGGTLNLIGVDYQSERLRAGDRSPLLHGIEALVRPDIPNILLSHNPNTFDRAAALGIELSLAGHTHGGQVRLEILDRQWSPARFITNFVAGLYRLPLRHEEHEAGPDGTLPRPQSAFLYVNSGLGTLGLPVRLGVPPEITVLTLRAVG
jgi:predicted MPP superfamily phosphohydrolase